jgi:hypothetical protein
MVGDLLAMAAGQRVHGAFADIEKVAMDEGAAEAEQAKGANAVRGFLINEVKIGNLMVRGTGRELHGQKETKRQRGERGKGRKGEGTKRQKGQRDKRDNETKGR